MHHKKRDFLYDNIKGIIVYFIVLIHFIGATIKNDMLWAELLNTGVALTSMSVLLFVSGFFSKNPRHNTVEAVIQRLLIPYLLICVLRVPWNLLLKGRPNFHVFTPPFAMWYLVILAFYRILVETLRKIPGILALSLVAALGSGLVGEMSGFPVTSRIICYFPFFLLGYQFRPDMVQKLREERYQAVGIALGVLSVAVTFMVSYLAWRYQWSGNIYWNNTTYTAAKMDAGLGLALRSVFYILGVLAIFAMLLLIPAKETIFSRVGRNSLVVYLFHTFLYLVLENMEVVKGGQIWQALLVLALSVAVTWALSRDVFTRWFDRLLEETNRIIFHGSE